MKIMPKTAYKIIVYSDVHVPHEIDFAPVLKFQKSYDPQYIILNGDFLNMDWCSHWTEPVFKELGFGKLRKHIIEELNHGEALIARIHATSPKAKIFFVPGNHEKHLAWCSIYFPALGIASHLNANGMNFKSDVAKASDHALALILEEQLHAIKYDMDVLDYNEELTIGHQTFLHGHQLSISNSPRLYPMKNLVYGHYHQETCVTLNDSGSGDGKNVVQHRCIPCMTKLGPEKPGYLGSKSTKWLNGFYISEARADHLFDGRVKKLLGGKIMVP